MKVLWSLALAIVGIGLMGMSLSYAIQGDYARATFDLVLGIFNLEGARRAAQ